MDVESPWVPKTEEEKDQVRRQMERLLKTAHFRNSRRYPALFRFIVEETLEGRGEFLKERLLGVRVFNRPPDYDTADDPIARVTIAEIRKRIAQYYHEQAHDSEMRIELMPGRYEPEFYPRKARPLPAIETSNSDTTSISTGVVELASYPAQPAIVAAPEVRRSLLARLRWWVVTASALGLIAILALLWRLGQPAALDQFWSPVLKPGRTITFCLPSGAAGSRVAAAAGILTFLAPANPSGAPSSANSDQAIGSSFLEYEKNGENVVFSDVVATMRISNWIATHGVEQKLRLDQSTTLDDLQQGPTVFIGGLDNAWTLRALAHLRYRFHGTNHEQWWIVDAKDPGSRKWGMDLEDQIRSVKRDYALIARVHDDSTGQVVVIVAGIGMSGTAAAGEFVVDPNRLEELRKRVGAGFKGHDFEAVLGTDVVNGLPGSAKILAVEVW
jgi:hypothetical protein